MINLQLIKIIGAVYITTFSLIRLVKRPKLTSDNREYIKKSAKEVDKHNMDNPKDYISLGTLHKHMCEELGLEIPLTKFMEIIRSDDERS